ncbi:MAG: twin-arginine translocase TatA/TatE family subunit [Mariprofundus sp.]
MFGIGFPEIVVILVLIVLVVGPEQLPGVLRKGFSFIKEAKRHIADIQAEVHRQTEPLRKPLEDMVSDVQHEDLKSDLNMAQTRADPDETNVDVKTGDKQP